MMVLGITGGIGSGKSTAADYLVSLGFVCIDADQIGRDITADGSPVLDIIDEEFGPKGKYGNGTKVLSRGDGSNIAVLDRKALASVVFRDSSVRKHFDEIVQTKIIDIIGDRITELQKARDIRGILLDAPLMFEAGCDSMCDAVILVTADIDMRIARVIQRDNTTEEDIRSRIANQMSDEQKMALSDYVVDNSGSPLEMYRQLDKIVKELGV